MKDNDLIGCCGIYCGACFAYRKEISDKAKSLRELLKKEKFNKIAKPFKWVGDYREFRKWLSWLVRLKCDNGCQAGDGNPFCSIRKCCRKKGFVSCADCELMPCKKLEWISKRYKKWNIENLKRIREVGYKKWLKEQRESVKKGFITGEVIRSMS
jgi:hypothetical protein